MKYGIIIIIVSLSALICLSCKKDKDLQHPIINIDQPLENQHFRVMDTIMISAVITDDNILASIKVVLVNEEFIPVLNANYYYPNSKTYNLQIEYIIDDYHMKSGDYYIQIRADDGANFKNKYRKVFIKEVPVNFRQVVVITRIDDNLLKVLGINDSLEIKPLFEINGDFASSEINSRYQHLYVAGRTKINIAAFNLLLNEQEWELEHISTQPMHNYNCLYFDEYLFSSFYRYYLRAYNNIGATVFNYSTDENELPGRIFRYNDLVFVDMQNISGGDSFIVTYYFNSGIEKQRMFSSFRVVEFFSMDQENIVILANSNETGLLLEYNPFQNILTELEILEDNIKSSVKIDNENILISTDNDVYHYSFSQFILSKIFNGKRAYRMKYETISKTVYFIESKEIETYQYPEMIFMEDFVFSDSILNVHLHYNK